MDNLIDSIESSEQNVILEINFENFLPFRREIDWYKPGY